MKILIVGRGWTGLKAYNECIRRGLDATIVSNLRVRTSIIYNKPDVVLNCAGVTGIPNVDACEITPHNTYNGNVNFPIELYHFCKERHIPFGHFSSGCIYTGTISRTDAPPNFFGSTYSISKGISDTYLKTRAWVFRIRMPFSNEDCMKNYLTKIKHYAKNGKLWNGGQNSLSHHDEAIGLALDTIIEDMPIGPYNLVNSGSMNLEEICARMNIKGEWMSDLEFEQSTRCKRSNCVIPADPRMRSLQEALDSVR